MLLQANVRNYYMQFEETQTQDEIDIKIKEFEERSRGAFAAQVSMHLSWPFSTFMPHPVSAHICTARSS